ncbi:cytochrome [Candidatus Kaiserbacteria bacterium RIFCSPHIGHO2_02_FULL_59_21]|uniref:Cytochrome n=1 Tax=Candidatus Kaiserbacteria bacterium RIFCSPHIGHO2_02_FULL_59_21 TaxID=1798500 RepID=A0A1F6DZT0_9BACT|nr:MAG: cytochrome [Candidatus Kaiserbacteria bacterium RIFCSPHIGHO2_01_FULL_58_22]OGG66908.1 MAG: cytochrome [Candidatus Kaiserbacteria bacterium RIFCSPHIGHO2_02_FULL_59_21]OGG80478.1 MAG: cytochrome [Candidatus Kaiserbacteria bacterium RIFCSPLOWO2_01_FULL_59_34]OGG86632.1 MAG: cytochrome [Candidatus Kaiserbacteria bacterium RIFCSPLOWO2_02_FULL_59_19]
MRRAVIGIMGSGNNATAQETNHALELGERIAKEGWILLSGGRSVGVMDAASKGAKSAGGLTLGIGARSDDSDISEAVDIAIITGMGSARNTINVLSSSIIVAIGGNGSGTLSEIALALKSGKHVIVLGGSEEAKKFLQKVGGKNISFTDSPEATVKLIKRLLAA